MVLLKEFILLASLLFASAVAGFEEYRVLWSASRSVRDAERDINPLDRRQNIDPPVTSQPVCDDDDGFFYTTTQKNTFQLQCKTRYDGKVLGQTSTSNYTDCILLCEQLNSNIAPGFCVGVTFNDTSDTSSGTCTGYGQIVQVSKIDSSSAVLDSALLIYGSDGNQYAAPVEDPGSTSTLATSSIETSEGTILSIMASPTIEVAISNLTSVSLSTLIPISTAGPRPVDATTDTSRDITSPLPTGSVIPPAPEVTSRPSTNRSDIVQTAVTSIVSYTIYRVQVVEVCGTSPSNCLTKTSTSTEIGYRTQISCLPGLCDGVVVVNNVTAPVVASTCVVSS